MDGERLGELMAATHPAPGWWVIVITGVLAAAIAVTSTAFRSLNVISTVAHEAGHALGAIVTGGGVYVIAITGHDSGHTYSWTTGRFSSVVSVFSGYATPALSGLGLAVLVDGGRSSTALAIVAAAAVLVLLVSRDLLTVGVVIAICVSAAALLVWAPLWVQYSVVSALVWLLILSEAVHIIRGEISRFRNDSYPAHDDADSLAEQTRIPAHVWLVAWLALIGWCLWSAAVLLWP